MLLAAPVAVGLISAALYARQTSPLGRAPWPEAPGSSPESLPPAPALRIPERAPPLDYELRGELDPQTKTLRGEVRVALRNRSDKPLSELRFHLYLNAFAHDETRFAKSSGGVHRGQRRGTRGHVRVEGAWVGKTKAAHREIHDGTVLSVRLPGPPRPPGAPIVATLNFSARLPRIYARTGHAGDFFMIAQWYPKLGVLRSNGSWFCPPFHANEEFFANFARYRLRFTLPARYRVGHSGALRRRELGPDGSQQTLHVEARWVHDMALAAWPHFVEHRRQLHLWGRTTALKLRLLTVPGRGAAERQLELLVDGLQRLARWFGAYPYEQLTVVDVPARARGADAMEYPQLFTVWFPYGAPEAARSVDEILLHELTHQYFQGLLASDEVREPWLDEGLTTFVSALLLDARLGPERSFVDLEPLALGQRDKNQLHQASGAERAAIAQPAAAFRSWHRYGSAVYGRTAALLTTYQSLVGRRATIAALRRYVQRQAFRHPTRADLLPTLIAAAPEAQRPLVRRLLKQTLDGVAPFEVALRCEKDGLVLERGGIRLPLELRWRRAGETAPRIITVGAQGAALRRFETPGLIDAEVGPRGRLPLSETPIARRCSNRSGALGASLRLWPLAQQLLSTVAP